MSVRAVPTQSFFLQPYERLPEGMPSHALGDSRPTGETCPRCSRDWITLLSLDCTDPRLELATFKGRLRLAVCPACGNAAYVVANDGELAALPEQADRRRPGSFELELEAPAHCPVALHAIPDRVTQARALAAEGRLNEAAAWAGNFDWQTFTHQVGGGQIAGRRDLIAPSCPTCSRPLPFLACAATVAGCLPAGDSVAVCFFACRGCQAVVAVTTGPAVGTTG